MKNFIGAATALFVFSVIFSVTSVPAEAEPSMACENVCKQIYDECLRKEMVGIERICKQEHGECQRQCSAPLAIGETRELKGLKFRFDDVIEDSRCPPNADCIQRGDVVAKLSVAADGCNAEKPASLFVSNEKPGEITVGSSAYNFLFSVLLADVQPIDKALEKSAYRIKLIVRQTGGNSVCANIVGSSCPAKLECRLPTCAREAKQCSDGVGVGRNPLRNCEFDPCSGEIPACPADARVCPDGTSVGRDPYNNCQARPCPGETRNNCEQCRQTYDLCVADAQRIAMAPGPNRDRAVQSIMADCKRDYNNCLTSCKGAEPTQSECEKGCYASGFSKCVPNGARLLRNEAATEKSAEPMYCDIDGTFKSQKTDGSDAQNSYECLSNFQSDGKCVSVSENLNILQKIVKWFSKIFGGS